MMLLMILADVMAETNSWMLMVTALAAAGTFLTALIGTIVAIKTLKNARNALLADHERRQGDATMSIMQNFINMKQREWKVIREECIAMECADAAELLRSKTASSRAREAHRRMLHEVELIGLGCRLHIYSLPVVRKSCESELVQLWEISSTYIYDARNGSPTTGRAQETAYENFGWLNNQLAKSPTDVEVDKGLMIQIRSLFKRSSP